MERIALIACTKRKQGSPCAAGELYMPSQLFRAARAYADRFADRYLILSAKHGVLDSGIVIEPYEETLKGAPVAFKRHWAAMAASKLATILPTPCHLVLLAGADYRVELLPWLHRLNHSVEMPIPSNFRMAEQTRWLTEQAATC